MNKTLLIKFRCFAVGMKFRVYYCCALISFFHFSLIKFVRCRTEQSANCGITPRTERCYLIISIDSASITVAINSCRNMVPFKGSGISIVSPTYLKYYPVNAYVGKLIIIVIVIWVLIW